MSAPTSHDPVAVNTRDDRCWVRRGWTPGGHGLYALEGSPADAEQTLYLIGDLAAFGLRSMAHVAFPVPGGSERPDGITRAIVPVQALREDDEFHLHHDYRVPRDLPKPAGVQTSGACKACGSMPEQWCPDCAACQRGCYDAFVDNLCTHANASWVGVE